jgi:hypothetical protein
MHFEAIGANGEFHLTGYSQNLLNSSTPIYNTFLTLNWVSKRHAYICKPI